MKLLNFLRKIRKKYLTNYQPSVEILISKTNLLHNLAEYQKQYPKLLFAPVLKSNAYGHGLVPVAKILDEADVAFLVLDSLHEAMILRNEGIELEILIIGHTQSENIKNSKLARIAFTIIDLEQLRELAKIIHTPLAIHLKVDTGMHRQGILPEQISEAINLLKSNNNFKLEGLCSHLADVDNKTLLDSQIARWTEARTLFQKSFPSIKFFHLAATAGIDYSERAGANVARLGLGLYGINSSSQNKLNLKPVLQMQTIVSSLKKIPTGEFVGYSATYQAKRDVTIATVPAGYFEGVDRRLSSRGVFKIGNNYCPIVGRVSMNITSLDVTNAPETRLRDKVTIISNQPTDENSVEKIAQLTNTIPWEILIHLPPHLRRIIRD